MPPRATLLADARSRLLADARQNADVAARAVKGALSSKLDSIKDHLFADVQGGGLRLAGYRILRRIGSGGMSSIYLATREADGILLVLKILDANRQDADQMARFVREYTLLASIDHPHIIRIFNQGFSDRHAYIAMEYFENGDLRSRMTGAMEPGEVVAIVLQVAQALSAIHALGIVHRDLKPENLMVRADGSIALADFGIAKALGPNTEVDPVLTQHGDIVGSPSYISPEQILGKPVTPRSDLYSLGVMLFEMLTGARPYQGSTLTTILALHTQAPPPELPTRLGHFQPIIDKLMAKDPAHRHESAEQLAQELRRLG
jgi:serine/threonine protein kinase